MMPKSRRHTSLMVGSYVQYIIVEVIKVRTYLDIRLTLKCKIRPYTYLSLSLSSFYRVFLLLSK